MRLVSGRSLLQIALVAAALILAAEAVGGAGRPPRLRQVRETVAFPPLRATLTLPAGKGPFPAVIMLSGSGQNDQDETVLACKPFKDIALALAARGVASLRYDKRTRAYPTSIDPVTFTPLEEYVPDALEALRLLQHRATIDRGRIFVLGHSLGGRLAPLTAKRAGRGIAGVILLAASSEPFGASLLRQIRYLATLPDPVGTQARAQLPRMEQIARRLDSPELAQEDPSRIVYLGVGPTYYLSLQRHDAVATARSIPQPILIAQGDRDYQVTVADDLKLWLNGLRGRKNVKVVRFPKANHFFVNGTGPSSPLDCLTTRHVDPKLASTIAAWITSPAQSPATGTRR